MCKKARMTPYSKTVPVCTDCCYCGSNVIMVVVVAGCGSFGGFGSVHKFEENGLGECEFEECGDVSVSVRVGVHRGREVLMMMRRRCCRMGANAVFCCMNS